MGRKKQNPEESAKRMEILKKAEQMFMTGGFSAISMDALAEAVPVSKRTLYNHFKDKKSIFTAVMQARCQKLAAQMAESIQEDSDAKETLSKIARQFLDLVLKPESVKIYRTAITESQQFPELGQLFFESGPKRSVELLSTYFKILNEKGSLKIENTELAAKIFIGMLTNRVHMQCMLGLKVNVTAQEKNDIVNYAVRIFLSGHKA